MPLPDLVFARDGASTPVPVTWLLFDDGADRIYTSINRTWDDLSEPYTGEIYGQVPLTYSLTKRPMNKLVLYVHHDDVSCEITPPEPVPFFSFARYGLPLYPGTAMQDISPRWLYSLFGFFFDDYRFTWKVENSEKLIATVAKRSIPLAL